MQIEKIYRIFARFENILYVCNVLKMYIIFIMKENKLHTINFESFAGNFFGFWFYFFYTLKSFRDY
jgi:hypothetical protein